MGLPLLLTLVRILLSPIFTISYLYPALFGIEAAAYPYVLLIIVGICELTDIFDGFLARQRNSVTELGKVLDPMADSVFRLTVFFTLTQGVIQLPLILVLTFFFRDSIISSLRTLCALKGVALAARLSGKIKAIVQAAAVFFILILMIYYSRGRLELAALQKMSFYAALFAAIYTVLSACEYIWANWAFIRKGLKK